MGILGNIFSGGKNVSHGAGGKIKPGRAGTNRGLTLREGIMGQRSRMRKIPVPI